jgi:hypothetical protein
MPADQRRDSGFRFPPPHLPRPAPAARETAPLSFVVHVSDADLGLKPGLTRAELLTAINGHVIDQGEIVSIYERKAHRDIHLTAGSLKRAAVVGAAARPRTR